MRSQDDTTARLAGSDTAYEHSLETQTSTKQQNVQHTADKQRCEAKPIRRGPYKAKHQKQPDTKHQKQPDANPHSSSSRQDAASASSDRDACVVMAPVYLKIATISGKQSEALSTSLQTKLSAYRRQIDERLNDPYQSQITVGLEVSLLAMEQGRRMRESSRAGQHQEIGELLETSGRALVQNIMEREVMDNEIDKLERENEAKDELLAEYDIPVTSIRNFTTVDSLFSGLDVGKKFLPDQKTLKVMRRSRRHNNDK
jgi:hypothetical protein